MGHVVETFYNGGQAKLCNHALELYLILWLRKGIIIEHPDAKIRTVLQHPVRDIDKMPPVFVRLQPSNSSNNRDDRGECY